MEGLSHPSANSDDRTRWPENNGGPQPIPRFMTWPSVPRPLRSFISRKVVLPQRSRPTPTDSDSSLRHFRSQTSSSFTSGLRELIPSELVLRVKNNVLSRNKSRRKHLNGSKTSIDSTVKEYPRKKPIPNDKNDYRNKANDYGNKTNKDNNPPQYKDAHNDDDVKIKPPPDTLPTENKTLQEGPIYGSDSTSRNPTSPQNTHSNTALTSTQCFTASRAFDHAKSKVNELRDTLTESFFEGSYLIQVGFNCEMLGSNQGLLQEIYLFLENDVEPFNAEKIASTFEPFPTIVYTPSITYHYPLFHDTEDIWNLWRLRGIFCSDICERGMADSSALTDADGHSLKSTGDSVSSSSTGDSTGRESGKPHKKSNGKEDSNDNSDDGNGEEDDKDGGADDSFNSVPKVHWDACGTREVSIPFSSTLTIPGANCQPPARYKTNASVDITIESNLESQSRPPGLSWGGPWIEAKFSLLDAEIHVVPKGNAMCHLGLSQIRVMASDCLTSVLSYSPTIVRADGDTLKSAAENNNSVNLKGTIGAAPTLQIGVATASASSEERSQKRWEVVAHCLNSDRDENTGKSRTTMMWKYVHNDKYFPPEIQNIFEPRPSAIFGLSRQSSCMPKLEVEVVTDYSWSTPAARFRDWIIRSKKSFPAFTNFLHQVSVTINLTEVTERTEWVVGLNAEDRKRMSDIGKASQPMLRRLESNVGVSSCTIELMHALHGQIFITEEQRKEYKNGPHSLLAAPWNAGVDNALSPNSLPTPSPSPSPSLSPISPSGSVSADKIQ